jgi:hypothetical protein
MMPRPTISIQKKARHARRISPTPPARPVGPFGSSNVSMAAAEKPHDRAPHCGFPVAEPAVITQTQHPTLPISSNGRSRSSRKCLWRSHHDDGRCRSHQQPIQRSLPRFSAFLRRRRMMSLYALSGCAKRKSARGGRAHDDRSRWWSWRSDFNLVPETRRIVEKPAIAGVPRKWPMEQSMKVRRSMRIFHGVLFAPGPPSRSSKAIARYYTVCAGAGTTPTSASRQ